MILKNNQRGFTIIELLVVVVIIGILATVTIVAYNGITDRARGAAAASNTENAVGKIISYSLAHGGLYPAALSEVGVIDSGDNSYQYRVNNTLTPKSFCLTTTKGGVSYFASDTKTSPEPGVCRGHAPYGKTVITNIAVNPSVEENLSGYGTNSSLTRDNEWAADGAYSMKITPTAASNDSFINVGGDWGAIRAGLQPGKTYVISATVRLAAPQTGSFSANGARQITGWYTVNGVNTRIQGTQASNTAGATRVSVTLPIPANATAAWIRLYNGASVGNGVVWWDALSITEGNTVQPYADGNTNGWAWNGVENNSTSTGPTL